MQTQTTDQNHNSTQAPSATAHSAAAQQQPGAQKNSTTQHADHAATHTNANGNAGSAGSSEQTTASNHWSHKLTVLQFVGLMILPVTLISVVFTMVFDAGAGDVSLVYAPHLLILSLAPFCWLHGNRTVASAHADETRFSGLKILTFPPLVGALLFPFLM